MATALKLKNDIKKLKAAIGSKATPKSFVPKLKAQLDKAENELSSMKKSGRPRKTSTTKGTKIALTALQKLIQKKKYGVYQGAGVDLKKDAGEGAFATGRRTSKGLKSNQYGDAKSNKGNTYYEYRPNRLDVKQPKKQQTYPKLADGGMMADGGETSSKKFNTQYNVGKAKYVINYYDGKKTHKDGSPFYDLATFKNMKDFMAYKKKLTSEGYKQYKDGGMMAKGGEIEEGDFVFVKPEKLYADVVRVTGENVVVEFTGRRPIGGDKRGNYKIKDLKKRDGRRAEYADGGKIPNNYEGMSASDIWNSMSKGQRQHFLYDHAIEIEDYRGEEFGKLGSKEIIQAYNSNFDELDKNIRNRFENHVRMGQYAKGGMLNSIKEEYLQNEDENAHSENVVLLAKNFGTKEDLAKAKEILALHEKEGSLSSENGKKRQDLHLKLIDKASKEMSKEGIEFEKGGMMADGDEVDKELINASAKSIYDKKGMMSLRNTFLQLAKTDENAGDIETAEYRRKVVSEYQSKQPKYMADGGMMADGGEVGQSFSIKEMREKLNRMFPYSFGFSVNNVSKEGNEFLNSSALIVDLNDPLRGLEDKDIDSKLFFPQYKRDHNINYRIYQGGENTYFYFALESEKGDELIGQFGFKDRGDVSSDYITRFIAFLMEQYGLPFGIKHSVMAKGGYMAGGGEMHKADYFKDGGKVFSEKELKELLDEALGHFYQGLNQIDLAMRYLEVKGQGGLKTPLSNKLKLDDLRESVKKIDEYISK